MAGGLQHRAGDYSERRGRVVWRCNDAKGSDWGSRGGGSGWRYGLRVDLRGSRQTVQIRSLPAGATATLYDAVGNEMSSGKTPFVVELKRNQTYFKSSTYRLVLDMPGYPKQDVILQSNVNGWFIGNIGWGFIGAPIGMLIVDPLTGGMYSFDTNAPEATKLLAEQSGITLEDRDLVIVMKRDVPASLQSQLKPIK